MLDTEQLVKFLQIEFGRVGADTHLTPREVIRDFIELLDIMYQNPETDMEALLNSEQFALTESGGTSGDAGGPGQRSFAEFKI